MELTLRELWCVLHGMVFGAIFLLAFSGGFAGLYSLRRPLVTQEGVAERMRRLNIGMWSMAAIAWATVISGTWLVYIWYRTKPVAGISLNEFPRAFLLKSESTAAWHEFGMEWKEHVAWLVPIVVTSAAFVVSRYGRRLIENQAIRKAVMWMLAASFGAAAVAGVFGAFINKIAPIH